MLLCTEQQCLERVYVGLIWAGAGFRAHAPRPLSSCVPPSPATVLPPGALCRFQQLRDRKLAQASAACEKLLNEATLRLQALARQEGATVQRLQARPGRCHPVPLAWQTLGASRVGDPGLQAGCVHSCSQASVFPCLAGGGGCL